MASVANSEREVIGERTREGLAARRAEGVRLGTPPVLGESVVDTIVTMRDEGLSIEAIARRLNREGVPTAHGGRQWWASTVRAVVRSQRAPELLAMKEADV
jgi:DNA invertase Pin-like site-specific DNA recombinase